VRLNRRSFIQRVLAGAAAALRLRKGNATVQIVDDASKLNVMPDRDPGVHGGFSAPFEVMNRNGADVEHSILCETLRIELDGSLYVEGEFLAMPHGDTIETWRDEMWKPYDSFGISAATVATRIRELGEEQS